MSRRIRTGPVRLTEIKFAKTARGDHFQNQKMLTSEAYDMYVSADTLPGFVVITSKLDRDLGSVYITPVTNIESAKVAEQSLTQYQPLGTAESHDTPSGNKKNYNHSTIGKR